MHVAVDFRRFFVDRTASYCNSILQWRYFLCRFGDGFSPSAFLLSPDKYGDFWASAVGGCSTAKYPLQTATAIFQFFLSPQSATTHCNIPTTPFKGGRYVAVGCCTHFVSIFSPQIFGKKMKKLSPKNRAWTNPTSTTTLRGRRSTFPTYRLRIPHATMNPTARRFFRSGTSGAVSRNLPTSFSRRF